MERGEEVMTVNRKVTGRAMSMPGGVGIGVAVSYIITLLGSALMAWLIDNRTMQMEGIGYGVMAMLLLASGIGAFVAKQLVKRRPLLVCTVCSIMYFLALLATTALFFGGKYHGVGVTLALIAGGGMCVAVLGVNKNKSATKSRRKIKTG
jgi:putative membrane protein (TIGR04086 family)